MDKWVERVKSRMKDLGITQQMLADQLDITRSAVAHYLSGRRAPPIAQFSKLAKILQSEVGWLLGGGGPMEIQATLAELVFASMHPVPILSWEEAITFTDVNKLEWNDVKEWVPHFFTGFDNSYGLKIKGDAMTAPTGQGKSFHEGDIIIVDYGVAPKEGDFVIAHLPNTAQVTFKQYVSDSGKHYLKPLNPQYPTIPIDDTTSISAVLSYCVSGTKQE